ncbi:unnamed protein product [Heligmosomoides polygyrus]|uniref:Uncharacterized protein n=1 Tax=Heligmosomoides polygyrus TaxID=6339 RepID=A0A183F1Z2_HELPZ|nr:unnamed protein product [Heligmosomoides polygyrus]
MIPTTMQIEFFNGTGVVVRTIQRAGITINARRSPVSPVSPVIPLIINLLERAPTASAFDPVECQSAPMDPLRSRDTKSVISVVQFFHEEV